MINLKPSVRMPVFFVGHGSPMNVIEDTTYRQSWQALGHEFGQKWPKPQLILCISAHWLTQGWWLTAMAQPKTIHDFGGFPQALFDQQYLVSGFPAAAQELASLLIQPDTQQPLYLDEQTWGLDHGAWGVLKPMFPSADVPVIQLSMDASQPIPMHYQLGQQLKKLRNHGVLIVASGNIVHNLRALRRDAPDNQTYDWAMSFDQAVAQLIESNQLPALQDAPQLPTYGLAHPTSDHFLPLLYAAGAVEVGEPMRFFNTGFQAASISMRSVIWD
ncbi:4,5-DOPA dioxygenase extradiol [Rhodoferax lithotrophicus]|uniref:4,5-DOPA dioxygenase extradiol n=1 Tax=Rhodoferax lithotrophicus TaxID=2798804 RepID=A0ABN6D4E3_9BURK|nr:4,5-DOPA dioxygenase extradiol [Rhodoferax sp. MIZ03]BCO26855.1 4,5-DOPA dioxygenase extradiol [Rhodoferax sp. MIZ03]